MARILVIDDETAMRDMMVTALEAAGHTVTQSKNARNGLEAHRANPVDLIITDLVMREMDGTEFLRRLHAFSPATPVVAVSGNRHSTIYLNMAKLLGAQRILAKPFSPQTLVDAVAGALGESPGQSPPSRG